MGKQRMTDEQLREMREQLDHLRSSHHELLHEAGEVSPRSVELYHSIWDAEEQLLNEFDAVQESIQLADFLLHRPKC